MEKKKLLYFLKRFFRGGFTVVLLCSIAMSDSTGDQRIITSIENRVSQEKPKYEKIIAANKKEYLKHEKSIKKAVKQAEAAFKKHTENFKVSEEDKGGIIDKIVQNAKNLEIQKKQSKTKGLIVFVSFSMPKELLLSYHKQAQVHGGRLVMRGLIDNSFKKTISAMQLSDDQTLIMDINPNLFKDHSIKRVPTIVLSNNNNIDKFTGSVSLKYALDEASSKGDCREFATNILKKTNKGDFK